MSVETVDLRTINTIISILRKFPPIQNKAKYEYHRRGKSFFYGLKSSDFNKFTDLENGERLFNYWRDKLVESRLLLKIFPNKQKGSPYAITPFGIAFLIQNLDSLNTLLLSFEEDDYPLKKAEWDKEVSNCINVVKHFARGIPDIQTHAIATTFLKACKLISFTNYAYVLQTVVGEDIEADLALDISRPYNDEKTPEKIKQDFEDTANHLLGNSCWISLHHHNTHKRFTEYREKTGNFPYFQPTYMPENVIQCGKMFGDKVVLKFLSEESQRVVEQLTH